MKKMQNFILKFKNLITDFRGAHLFNMVRLASVVFLFTLIPFGGYPFERPVYQTTIQFSENGVIPLNLPEKVVKVETGCSRIDVETGCQNYDPETFKSLMKEYGEQFGIDWKLVFAIGYHESGNFTSHLARTNNNFFGRKAAGGGYASWSTPQEGIRNQFEYLKTRYFDRGLTTPASINRVYAEDGSWHYAVESVMNAL